MTAKGDERDGDEDSGLHDIRSLASSAKLRLSSRRSTQNPIIADDDVLASSSAGWKAVALPEPAKMVSLPELANLPTKAQVEALDRQAAKARSSDRADKKVATTAAAASATEAPLATVASIAGVAPAVAVPEMPSIGSRIMAQQGSGRGKIYALVGLGLAAAAGAAVFVMSNKDKDAQPAAGAVAMESKPAPARTAKLMAAPEQKADEAAVDDLANASGAVEPEVVVPEEPAEPVPTAAAKPTKDKKAHKVEIRDTVNKDPKTEVTPPPPPKVEAKGSGDEPSFDDLLKEAGVKEKQAVKPKLDKKALSGGDIKTGMRSVAGKALACYNGTQGTAAVKLTVDPSGAVQKVNVSGVFAKTPVGACVESAVKSASFPPWDGGPQSFGYSYLLQAE